MENLILKQFDNSKQLATILWQGRPTWIAKQLAELAGQADPSNSISVFLKDNDFLENKIDYEILEGAELKEFKQLIGDSPITNLSKVRNLTIFREPSLWAYLQSLRTEGGKVLKRWINREVLPSIRKDGAYITENANPEFLREKANELEKLETINKSVELVSPLLDVAGVDNTVKLLVVKTLFSKAGVDIPIEIEAKEKFYDTKQIAKMVGMYSKTGNPAFGAVGQIIKKLDIEEHEKKAVWESSGSWQGTVIKYIESVSDKVNKWLEENGHPVDIPSKNKTFHVVYKPLREVAI